jgi:hypothetical protein
MISTEDNYGSYTGGTPNLPPGSASRNPSCNKLLVLLNLYFSELKMAGATGSHYSTLHLANPATTSSLKDKPLAHFGAEEDDAGRAGQSLAGATSLVCPLY